MAIGDALGAHVEFRPRSYLEAHRVKDLEAGGTWGLEKGQVGFLIYFRLSNKIESFFILRPVTCAVVRSSGLGLAPKTLRVKAIILLTRNVVHIER